MITPPPGSRITVTLPQEDNVITLPAAANPSRYFIAAFLLFWLGGWLIGELSVLGVLLAGVFHLVTFQPSNDSAAGVGGLFMLFWARRVDDRRHLCHPFFHFARRTGPTGKDYFGNRADFLSRAFLLARFFSV